jgi:hypothetical protein
MKMIEKGARLLYDNSPDKVFLWEHLPDEIKLYYKNLSRVFIEGMRIPTSQMQNNYYEMRMATGHGKINSCFPFAVWECAIDAALKEE